MNYNVKIRKRGVMMIKKVKLLEIEKKFFSKKVKVMARDGWVYDFEWKMGFKNESYWQQFLNKIKKAESDIEEGRVYTQKEMNEYYRTEYGINV